MHRYVSVAFLGLSFLIAGLVPLLSWGQSFPSKPITVIAPYGPGVALDTACRYIVSKLAERTGWTIIVDNRPGADGVIGVQAVLNLPADGHAVLAAISTLAILPTSKKGQLPYDPIKDLVPLTRFINFQSLLFANPSFAANTFAEALAWSKANPGKLDFATSGRGSWNHLLGELLKLETGIDMTNIAYKAGPQMTVDLMAGVIPLVVVSAPEMVPHVRAGKVKALVAIGTRRAAAFPNVPAISETIPSFASLDTDPWAGFMVKAGTPAPLIARLHGEIVTTLRAPETRTRIAELGGAPVDESPESYRAKYQSDIARWDKVVTEAKLKFD